MCVSNCSWILGVGLLLANGGPRVLAQTKQPAPAKPNLLVPSTLKAKAPDLFDVKLTTTKGDVVIHVTRAWAPLGADRFYNLVQSEFYTDATFFRVLPGFIAQFGISGRPDVSRAWLNT